MLDLTIVWFHHQSSYKDSETSEIILPWVRLHSVEDYLDMVSIIDDFPSIYLNFNITPMFDRTDF
jgi:alpha-amylase/alpha-mannosidase (GH57 family)